MFLPTTREEMRGLGWDRCDVILVTGDAYIDSPFIGAAVIGKILMRAGYRTGIIAQPDVSAEEDIRRLGEPALFWGVTGGSVDSMIANYTSSLKKRKTDDYTPGGLNNRRPDRAVIAYTNLIRRHFKPTVPIILGGIEASLRRIVHYDYWSDRLRKSILFDAKADALVYGMAERTVLELAQRLGGGLDYRGLRGICVIGRECPADALEIPGWDEVRKDNDRFIEMFRIFYDNRDPLTGRRLCQRHGDRYLIQNPPPAYESIEEMDRWYEVEYEGAAHPLHEKDGPVKALETIGFSIPTHRGCYGECNFCAIALHEGTAVRRRSKESIMREARRLTRHRRYRGYITDLSGPTANMYGVECEKKLTRGGCSGRKCLFPEPCPSLKIDHSRQTDLLRSLRGIPGIKKVFVASGIRYDMVLKDAGAGGKYLQNLVRHHLSGQLKIAPEHTEESVLKAMGKPGVPALRRFREAFLTMTRAARKDQHLTYYIMAAHPGCRAEHMAGLRDFIRKELHTRPEQVQIFVPSPSTWSTVMYVTGKNPFTGEKLFVERDMAAKVRQKELLTVMEQPGRNIRTRRKGR